MVRSRIVGCLVSALAMLYAAGAAPAQAAKQSGVCEFTRGVHTGWQLCRTRWTFFDYTDGRQEVFIIGVDAAVWHIWQRWPGDTEWSGWASLGGRIHWPDSEGNGVGLDVATRVDRPVITVIGTDRNWWCNRLDDLQGPRWTGWLRC